MKFTPTQTQKGLTLRLAAILLAVLTLAALWKLAGVVVAAVICVIGAVVVFVLAFQRARNRRTETIFRFYVTADEILGADGSSRYRFEIADAIKTGEAVVHMLPDPPPLSSFALGALYDSISDHNGAIGHLALAAEEEMLKESPHVSPSRQLRRYVRRLRQIERRPEKWPHLTAAIRNLERMHREESASLLAKNQLQLSRLVKAFDAKLLEDGSTEPTRTLVSNFAARSFKSITPPPPISEVLNDVYQEEQP